MVTPLEVLAQGRQKKVISETYYRNLPTNHPSRHLYDYHDWQMSEWERKLVFHYADKGSGIDHTMEKKDRWYDYGDQEDLSFIFRDEDFSLPVTRYGDGSYPVWYGACSEDVSKIEVIYHLRRQAEFELAETKKEELIYFERAMFRSLISADEILSIEHIYQSSMVNVISDDPPYIFSNPMGKIAFTNGSDGINYLSKRVEQQKKSCIALFKKSSIQDSRAINFFDVSIHKNGQVHVCGELL